jgi:hypothetical protein
VSLDKFLVLGPRTSLPLVDGPSIVLAASVLHPATTAEAAHRLGITVDEIVRVSRGEAFFYEGRVFVGDDLWSTSPEVYEGGANTIAELVAMRPEIADVVVTSLPALDSVANGERVRGRLAPLEAALLVLVETSNDAARLAEANAPAILIRSGQRNMQAAFDELFALHTAGVEPTRWEPSVDLVTGRLRDGPVIVPTQAPPHLHAGVQPLDAWLMESRALVMFEFASVLIGFDGEICDVFPTMELRPLADDGRYIQFAIGGGPTARSGYFEPAIVAVRDTLEHRWLSGDLPSSLPQHVAGDVCDVKWSAVFLLDRGVGYRVSPYIHSDQCGQTRTDASARYVFDCDKFIREIRTGRHVFDARHLHRIAEEVAAAKRASAPPKDHDDDDDGDDWSDEDDSFLYIPSFAEIDGRFLFVLRDRVVDEDGEVLHHLAPDETLARLDMRGRLLVASSVSVRVIDVVTGVPLVTIDLAPLAHSLDVPAYDPHWEGLLATFGTCAGVGRATPDEIQSQLLATTWADLDEETLAACVVRARGYPDVPHSVAVKR